MSKTEKTITVTTQSEAWAVLAAVGHVREAARQHGLDNGISATCQVEVAVGFTPCADVEGFQRALEEMGLADTCTVTDG